MTKYRTCLRVIEHWQPNYLETSWVHATAICFVHWSGCGLHLYNDNTTIVNCHMTQHSCTGLSQNASQDKPNLSVYVPFTVVLLD